MRRREFITLLGGAAVCSSVAGAQTARKRPVIGTFIQGTPTQNKGLRKIAASSALLMHRMPRQ